MSRERERERERDKKGELQSESDVSWTERAERRDVFFFWVGGGSHLLEESVKECVFECV